jgi:hypothetical protein
MELCQCTVCQVVRDDRGSHYCATTKYELQCLCHEFYDLTLIINFVGELRYSALDFVNASRVLTRMGVGDIRLPQSSPDYSPEVRRSTAHTREDA